MKKYLLIGLAIDGKAVNRNINNHEDSKDVVIKCFTNNPSIKSAILIKLSESGVRVQVIKGNINEFKKDLDKQFPNTWQQDQKIIDLAA